MESGADRHTQLVNGILKKNIFFRYPKKDISENINLLRIMFQGNVL
jgi:hypothetical protein